MTTTNIRQQITFVILLSCSLVSSFKTAAQDTKPRKTMEELIADLEVEEDMEVYDRYGRVIVDSPNASQFDINECREIFAKYSTPEEKKADSLYFKAQGTERFNLEEAKHLYSEATKYEHAHAYYRLAQLSIIDDNNSSLPKYHCLKAGMLGLPGACYFGAIHHRESYDFELLEKASSVNYLPAVELLAQNAIDTYRNYYNRRENIRVTTSMDNARKKAYSLVQRAINLKSKKANSFREQLNKMK